MRSIQQLVVLLFALFAFALAQEDTEYDATVYITSTVYRVNTVTMPGYPTGPVYNSTSVISPTYSPSPYPSANSTTVAPTGSVYPTPTGGETAPTDFPGAASHLSVNGLVAVLVAGAAYLAL